MKKHFLPKKERLKYIQTDLINYMDESHLQFKLPTHLPKI